MCIENAKKKLDKCITTDKKSLLECSVGLLISDNQF